MEGAWDQNEAAYITGRVTDSRHPANARDNVPHWVRYAFTLGGQDYEGTYSCQCVALETANPGKPIQVEYRRDDPKIHRPAGIVTESRLLYGRYLVLAGMIVIAIGVIQVLVGAKKIADGRD